MLESAHGLPNAAALSVQHSTVFCLGNQGLPHLDLSDRHLRTIMWSSKCLDNHPKETKKPIMSGHTWSDPMP